jgi:hypothetical protein
MECRWFTGIGGRPRSIGPINFLEIHIALTAAENSLSSQVEALNLLSHEHPQSTNLSPDVWR